MSVFPGTQISEFPDFQVPRFPDAAGAGGAAARRTLRSQPDPSPIAPRDQIRRKDPCCDYDLPTFVFSSDRYAQRVIKNSMEPRDVGAMAFVTWYALSM